MSYTSWFITATGSTSVLLFEIYRRLFSIPGAKNRWLCHAGVVGVVNPAKDPLSLSYDLGGSAVLSPELVESVGDGLYLGYISIPVSYDLFTSQEQWQQISASAMYLSIGYSPLGRSILSINQNGFHTEDFTYSIVDPANLPLPNNTVVGVAVNDLVPINGTSGIVTGIKPGFYNAVILSNAFQDEIDIRQNLRRGTTCAVTGVYFRPGFSVPEAKTPLKPITPPTLLFTESAPTQSTVPSSFWDDVRNPLKTYEDLWTSYPSVMPIMITEVYTLREYPHQSQLLSELSIATTGVATAVTGLEDNSDAMTSAITSVNTSVGELAANFNSAFGESGSQVDNRLNITGILAMIRAGNSFAAIKTAYPYESFKYASDIRSLMSLSVDERKAAVNTLLQSLSNGTSLLSAFLAAPELMELADVAFIDKQIKTGLFP